MDTRVKHRIRTRNTEHEKAVFKGDGESDALVEHSQSCNCDINWQHTKAIAIESVYFRRKFREASEIMRLKTGPNDANGLNRDFGNYVTTNTCHPLLDKIN